jgi:hypothetical protein
MNHFDHRLTWAKTLEHFCPRGPRTNPLEESPNHWKRHISLEQRNTHLAHGIANIVVIQAAAAR